MNVIPKAFLKVYFHEPFNYGLSNLAAKKFEVIF